MNITDIRTCDLKPYENNPRLNEDAVDLVVDKDLIIIAGHTRWKAAQKLGLETVPCIQAIEHQHRLKPTDWQTTKSRKQHNGTWTLYSLNWKS